MKSAIQICPNDQNLREEYKSLLKYKETKQHEWFSKMSGFLGSKKMAKIDQDSVLKEKINKQMYGE